MITLEQVSKVYEKRGEVRALDGLSLTIDAGEFVAVRGPSGCGKSTLLMTIAGMARPSAGRVLWRDEDLYQLSPRRRAGLRAERIGFVFQMFHLVPYLSVIENVLVPVLAGCSARRREAVELLGRFGMGDRLPHRPAELSTGERQRVALVRALIKQPDLILADEPTGNLDPENAAEVMGSLGEYHREGGTVVVVTHEALAEEYAGRTVRLEAGRVSEA